MTDCYIENLVDFRDVPYILVCENESKEII